jgi:hypothetical protein
VVGLKLNVMTLFQLISPTTGTQNTVFNSKFQAMKSLTHASNALPSAKEIISKWKVFEQMGWSVKTIKLNERN